MNILIQIIITMAFSAFFSGMEIAFVSSNKLRFEMDRSEKSLTSRILSIFFHNPNNFISTMLVGNNIALVIYGMQMAALLEPFLYEWLANSAVVAIAQTFISTLVILITGEFLPKMIFKINPNWWIQVFAVPMLLFYVLLYPISMFMSWISELLMRLFHLPAGQTDRYLVGRVDLDRLIH